MLKVDGEENIIESSRENDVRFNTKAIEKTEQDQNMVYYKTLDEQDKPAEKKI